jgi:multidrug efflux pump subunit AcrB
MSAIFLIVAITFAFLNAGVELFPDTDPTFAFAEIEAPSGTRIEMSDHFAHVVEGEVARLPDLRAYVTEVGSGGTNDFGQSAGAGPAHMSRISLEFEKREERTQSSRATLAQLREALVAFTGARLSIEKMEEGPPTAKPVNIEISGEDFALLGELAESVRARLRDIEGLVDLRDDYDRGRPEIQVRPTLDKAARLGLRTWDVANTVRTAIHGDDVSEYRVGEDEYDIVVGVGQEGTWSGGGQQAGTVVEESGEVQRGGGAGEWD